jgi:hypothetical protein
LAIADRGSEIVAVLTRDSLAETDRHGTSLEHFYVRESVCAHLTCQNNCLLCEPGKDVRLARLDEVEIASVGSW